VSFCPCGLHQAGGSDKWAAAVVAVAVAVAVAADRHNHERCAAPLTHACMTHTIERVCFQRLQPQGLPQRVMASGLRAVCNVACLPAARSNAGPMDR